MCFTTEMNERKKEWMNEYIHTHIHIYMNKVMCSQTVSKMKKKNVYWVVIVHDVQLGAL